MAILVLGLMFIAAFFAIGVSRRLIDKGTTAVGHSLGGQTARNRSLLNSGARIQCRAEPDTLAAALYRGLAMGDSPQLLKAGLRVSPVENNAFTVRLNRPTTSRAHVLSIQVSAAQPTGSTALIQAQSWSELNGIPSYSKDLNAILSEAYAAAKRLDVRAHVTGWDPADAAF